MTKPYSELNTTKYINDSELVEVTRKHYLRYDYDKKKIYCSRGNFPYGDVSMKTRNKLGEIRIRLELSPKELGLVINEIARQQYTEELFSAWLGK